MKSSYAVIRAGADRLRLFCDGGKQVHAGSPRRRTLGKVRQGRRRWWAAS